MRRAATSRSDFDCAFLLADAESKSKFIDEYLPVYVPLVRFYLGCLDDQWILEATENFGISLLRTGCDLDEGNVKSYRKDQHATLVKTPDEMFQWILDAKDDNGLEYRFGMIFARPFFVLELPAASLFITFTN